MLCVVDTRGLVCSKLLLCVPRVNIVDSQHFQNHHLTSEWPLHQPLLRHSIISLGDTCNNAPTMADSSAHDARPLGLFIQPACLQHRYIRHANSSHIFERPERLRAVLLGVAAAVARLEEADALVARLLASNLGHSSNANTSGSGALSSAGSTSDDLSAMLSGLSIQPSQTKYKLPLAHLDIVPPPLSPTLPGQILLHHKALQLAHSPPPDGISIPQSSLTASSTYLKDLLKWATEAVDRIRETGCEIPPGLGLNQGDLYLGPGSVLAIEGAVSFRPVKA